MRRDHCHHVDHLKQTSGQTDKRTIVESYSSNGVIELVGQRSELLFLLLGLGVDNRGEVESEIPGLAPEVVLDVGPRLLLDQPLHRNDLLCRLLGTGQGLSWLQRLEEEALLEGSVGVSGLVSVVGSSWQRTRTEKRGVNDVASHPCLRGTMRLTTLPFGSTGKQAHRSRSVLFLRARHKGDHPLKGNCFSDTRI